MPTLNDFSVLIHPGLNGAGPDHWQTHWEQAFPDFVRVAQADWGRPVYDVWAAKLTEYVNRAPKPVVLIPHSAGTSLVMKWTFDQPEAAKKVAGVFFVAPTDRDQPRPSPLQGFGGMILNACPTPPPSSPAATMTASPSSARRNSPKPGVRCFSMAACTATSAPPPGSACGLRA